MDCLICDRFAITPRGNDMFPCDEDDGSGKCLFKGCKKQKHSSNGEFCKEHCSFYCCYLGQSCIKIENPLNLCLHRDCENEPHPSLDDKHVSIWCVFHCRYINHGHCASPHCEEETRCKGLCKIHCEEAHGHCQYWLCDVEVDPSSICFPRCAKHCKKEEGHGHCANGFCEDYSSCGKYCKFHCEEEGHGHCISTMCDSQDLEIGSGGEEFSFCKVHCEDITHEHCIFYCGNDQHCEGGWCASHCFQKTHGHCAEGICGNPQEDESYWCSRHKKIILCKEDECKNFPHTGSDWCEKHCPIPDHEHCVAFNCMKEKHEGSILCVKHCLEDGHGHCSFNHCKFSKKGSLCDDCHRNHKVLSDKIIVLFREGRLVQIN